MNKEKKTFIDFLLLLTKWRKSIFINLFLVGVISIVISFMLPKWYKATAVVMPPADAQAGGGLSSLLNTLPIASLGLGMGGGSEMTYMAILKSRSLARDVIKKYDLQNFYEKLTLEETYLSFYSDYDAQLTEENMIAITFEYTDSIKVAEIVNYIVGKLGRTSTDFMLERAINTKGFVEKRYFQNLRDIDSLAIAMEQFQTEHGIIEFFEQTKAIINVNAELEAKIFIKKAEADAIKKSFGESTPQYSTIQIEMNSLQNQLQQLKHTEKSTAGSPFSSLFIPMDQLPELGKEYTELYTNYLLQQKLQEYLLPEYEQAKLQVMKDKPTLQIIDNAVPPDRKSKPKKALVVIGAVMVAFIIQFLFILLIEHIAWLKENDPKRFSDVAKIKKSWLWFSK